MKPNNLIIETQIYQDKGYDFGLSIPLTCYNENPEDIKICLESLFKQDFPYIELIIINDGPDNNWVEESIFQYLNETNIPDNIIKLQYVRNAKNMGVVYSKNLGFDLCTQKYIMQFDADFELLPPSYLSCCVGYLESHPDCFGIIGDMIFHYIHPGSVFISVCSGLEDLSNICKVCGPPIYVMFPNTSLDNLRYRECIQFDGDFWIRFWYKNRNKKFKLYNEDITGSNIIYVNNEPSYMVVLNHRTDDLNSPYAANIGPENVERFKQLNIEYSLNMGVHHEYMQSLPGNDVIYNYFLNS